MNLREFEDRACTKCGGTRVGLRYCEGTCIPGIPPRFVDVRSNGDPLIPHLHVTCACCDHEWLVKPMDAKRSESHRMVAPTGHERPH